MLFKKKKDPSIWDEPLSLLLAAYLMMLGRQVHQLTDLEFKDKDSTGSRLTLKLTLKN